MQTSHFLIVNKSFPSFKWLVPEMRKVLQKISRVSVTPTFHLFFMHWSHYPPIWMSPSDYQSFIYFRAVSHKKKRVYKSVTCHRFLSSPLLEPVCWVTPMTRVFCFFVEGSVTPVTHRYCENICRY